MYRLQAQKRYLWLNTRRPRLHSIYNVVKTDRVSDLRKQYDAFLEEDKARKERNEYILGKLDKMRFCNTVVPLRHKYIVPDVYEHHLKEPTTPREGLSTIPLTHNFSLGLVANYIGEKVLLQEMCKKYIMIPKTDQKTNDKPVENSQLPKNNYTETVTNIVNDQSDWKRKYDILNKLKKDEVKKDFSTTTETLNLKNEPNQSNHYILTGNLEKINTVERDTNETIQPELPERDNYDNTSLEQIPKQSLLKEMRHLSPSYVLDINAADENISEIQNIFTFQNYREQGHTDSVSSEPKQNDVTEPINKTKVVFDQTQLVPEGNHFVEAEHDNIVFKDNEEQLQIMTPKEFVNDINNDGDNIQVTEQYEYPIDIIQTHDFTPVEGVALQDGYFIKPEGYSTTHAYINPPGHNVSEYRTENFNPEVNPTQAQVEYHVYNQEKYINDTDNFAFAKPTQPPENDGSGIEGQNFYQSGYEPMYEHDDQAVVITENTDADALQIEEFDAEQNDMFYSEQTDNQNVDDQHVSEHIGPNIESYANYEAAEQPIDINEHEETNQYYDQSYEQQYANFKQPNQEYNHLGHEPSQGIHGIVASVAYNQMPQDEQGTYDQIEVNYNQSQENYDQTQLNYDQLHYEETNYEKQGQVEQELDYEQGSIVQQYIQNQHFDEQKPEVESVVEPIGEVAEIEDQHLKTTVAENINKIPEVKNT